MAKIKNQTNLIFTHKLLKAIGDSIIKVFIPLYILKSTNDIKLAMLYLLVYSLSTIIYMVILKKFILKYGVLSIMLHAIPLIVNQMLLSFYTIDLTISIVCGLLIGLAQTLYSIPLNLMFSYIDKNTDVAKFEVSTNIGKLVFILISGYLLSSNLKNSFLFLSLTASVIYIASIIPIMFAYNLLKSNYDNFKNAKTIKDQNNDAKIDNKTYIKYNIFHISFGLFQFVIDNIVPLYLYINNLSFESVTIVIALIELFKVLANYLAKFFVKHNKQLLCSCISTVLFLVSTILIMIFKTPIVLYILSCLISVTFPLVFVPMFHSFCTQINQDNNIIQGHFVRDCYIFSGRVPACTLLYFFPNFYFGFGIGIGAIIVMFVIEFSLLKSKKNTTTNDVLA